MLTKRALTPALVLSAVLVVLVALARWRLKSARIKGAVTAIALPIALASGAYGGVRAYANLRPPPDPLPARDIAPGIRYERRVDPGVPRVEHWVTVDLTRSELEIVITDGDDEALPLVGQTTTDFARAEGAIVAVNGGFFEPWEPGLLDPYPGPGERVAPLGLAASRGHVYGKDDARVETLFVAEDGSASFERPSTIFSALSGGCLLVRNGSAIGGGCGLPRLNDKRQPRTAVGLSADRKTMWLVVVDGRQARYSAGATLDELAALFVAQGAHNALNLDGGGSSVLVARGASGDLETLSTPMSGGVPGNERVVGSHLGVRRKGR